MEREATQYITEEIDQVYKGLGATQWRMILHKMVSLCKIGEENTKVKAWVRMGGTLPDKPKRLKHHPALAQRILQEILADCKWAAAVTDLTTAETFQMELCHNR